VPHPSEPVVQIRIQTVNKEEGPTAIDTLKQACQTLSDHCDVVLEKLEEILPEVKEDRQKIERLLIEDAERDRADEEMEEDGDD
jgi:DNA-directed RNA polymerase subunit L